MTDPQPPEGEIPPAGEPRRSPSGSDLADELREMGDKIKNVLQALWESQERKQVQQEIETGVSNLGASLNQAAREFQQSPAGQSVKEEFEELGERIRSGEMEASLRREFLSALRTANAELEKVLQKMSSAEKTETTPQAGTGPSESQEP